MYYSIRNSLENRIKVVYTLSGLVLGVFSSDIVEFSTFAELRKGFLLFGVLLALCTAQELGLYRERRNLPVYVLH